MTENELTPCRRCGHSIALDARFCPSCGTTSPWKSLDDIARDKDVQHARARGCLIAALVSGGLVMLLIVMLVASQSSRPASSESNSDEKLNASIDCQNIAMRETGSISGPDVDRAHERCMAARGYRKKGY